MVKATILLVDNDSGTLNIFKRFLESEDYRVFCAQSITAARKLLETVRPDLMITDMRLEDDAKHYDRSGLILAKDFAATIPVIVLTGFPSWDVVRQAFGGKSRAVDFVAKSEGADAILDAVRRALDTSHRENVIGALKIGGALTDADASVYIPRSAEQEVSLRLGRMDYLLIIEPRQQGKTSLINFLIRNPPSPITSIVYIDVASLPFRSERRWYRDLCRRLNDQMVTLAASPVDWTNPPMDSSEWRQFLTRLALSLQANGRLVVIALDEIGAPLPDATGFFSVLRDVYNSRQAEPCLRHITFILLGAFHPRDLIENEKLSPFNVSYRVRLPDFSVEQMEVLLRHLSYSQTETALLAAGVYYWTEGQPYLTQQLCAYLQPHASAKDIAAAVERLRREDENHLPHLARMLKKDEEGKLIARRVMAAERLAFSPTTVQSRLDLLGLISPDREGNCRIRNRIYVGLLESSFEQEDGPSASFASVGRRRVPLAPSESKAKGGGRDSTKTRILFLAADPSDATRLRLGSEAREIREKLSLAKRRSRFSFDERHSVRPADLSQALLEIRPQIVHFSGHGRSDGALCFEDEMGKSRPITADALASLFQLVEENLRCVILNACFSSGQADAIGSCIQYVIGMRTTLGDRVAMAFSVGFYQALGAGESIESAYRFGCALSKIENPKQGDVPVLIGPMK